MKKTEDEITTNIQDDSNKESANITLTEDDIVELIHEAQTEVMEIFQHQSEEFSGPVPHPEHMKQYKDIDETLPNRLVSMAESNLKHKQFVEKFSVIGQLLMGVLGWATPTSISFYVLYNAVLFIKDGKSIEALISLIFALTALGGAFYMKQKNKES